MWRPKGTTKPSSGRRGAPGRRTTRRIETSLIGKNVKIGRTHRKPFAYRFMVGDNSEVGMRRVALSLWERVALTLSAAKRKGRVRAISR
jgi:hypothetical protein